LVLHATTLRIPVVEVEGGTLTSVSGFDGHQGVALVVEPRRWATLDDVLAAARAEGEPPFILVLDHLEDPQNVGTLLRSAEACGVHGVVFPTRGSAPFSPAAVKASSGAVEHLRLVPMTDLADALVDLHARGVRIVGADGGASLTVREADLRGPVAIVVGSEGRGLQSRVRRRVDLMARIPMRGHVKSLNASVAGSVFLFEAAAQRGLSDGGPVAVEGAEGPVAEDERTPGGDAAAGAQPTAVMADEPSVESADTEGAADVDADEALLPEPPTGDATDSPASGDADLR
jgi:23S rRNA (guanosine2251-2'-O)-methyltransferase